MQSQQEFINAPQLRFSGFNDVWKQVSLKNLGEFIGGGTPSKSIKEFWKGQIPWVSSSDISDDNFKAKITRFITEDAVVRSATKKIPKGSLLIVSRVGVGKVAIADTDICTSQDFTNFIPHDEVDVLFMALTIKNKSSILTSFNQGTSIKGFTKDDLASLPIFIPTLTEQQKIASFLSSVDEWIENLRLQKESLEKYKKGMMQKMFSQQIRFKDENGKDFPDWEKCKLGDIADFLKGNGVSKEDITEDGQYKCVRYGELYTDYKELILEVISKTNSKNASALLSMENDVLIPSSGETAIDIATASCIKQAGVILGGDLNVLRFKKEQNGVFYAYYLTHSQKRNIAKYAQGNAVVHLYASHMKSLSIEVPTYEEQLKISTFLTSLDLLIQNRQLALIQAEQWKKGLVQKMFI